MLGTGALCLAPKPMIHLKHRRNYIQTYTHTLKSCRHVHNSRLIAVIKREKKETFANEYMRQSALFNFQSLLLVILLLICTCAYVHQIFPTILDRNKQGYATHPHKARGDCDRAPFFPLTTFARHVY
ncbi:hypothetical protein F5X96DRAFT_4719 [Biscogniauxia mediterranea]|nr:hypothetical protein F5X96DRAFT_4719 [Biscogniauxia mediterranea]